MVEAMDIRVGGRLGDDAHFGDVVVKKVPHWELNAKLLEIFELYRHHHAPRETFRQFAARTEPAWWEERLAAPEPAAAPA
jgi:ferredoxin-nitrite reductase